MRQAVQRAADRFVTIIVATLEAMAADRQVGIGGTRQYGPKLFTHDGRIYGGAGDVGLCALWHQLVSEGGDPTEIWPSDAEADDFQGLELGPDGIFHWGRWFTRSPMDGPYIAVGSGMDLALGALDAGVTLERAMQITCMRDAECGGEIDIVLLSRLQAR